MYGFDVTSEQIVNEWLTVLKGDDELTIFERSREGLTQIGEKTKQTFADDATMSETLRLLAGLPIKGNQLFLGRILSLPETSQGKTLNAVVRWLTQDLVILGRNIELVIFWTDCTMTQHFDPSVLFFCKASEPELRCWT